MILAQHICKHYICCVIFPPDISVRQGALSLDLNPTSHGYIDILETHEIRYLIIISHIIYTRRVLHILCWWGAESELLQNEPVWFSILKLYFVMCHILDLIKAFGNEHTYPLSFSFFDARLPKNHLLVLVSLKQTAHSIRLHNDRIRQ